MVDEFRGNADPVFAPPFYLGFEFSNKAMRFTGFDYSNIVEIWK